MNNMPMDLNDVNYDAFLVNYKNLNNPQITRVEQGSTVRLRIINGASMSNFWINFGKLRGTFIAVDGNDIKPIVAHKFQIGMGNRLDILVNIPKQMGYFPILAQVEGEKSQTGIILVNSGDVKIPKISSTAKKIAPTLDYTQELRITPLNKINNILIESSNQTIKLVLDGDMKHYVWTISGQKWPDVTPIMVGMGNIVIADIINNSMMSHPMHLHGYKFKIIEINGKHIKDGAIHDTILVMPHTNLKVAFIVDNPGKWFFHCHSLYHMHAGMMAYIQTK